MRQGKDQQKEENEMLKTYRFRVVGVSPLLMHNPASMANSGEARRKTIPTPEEEAEAGCYRDSDGMLVFPSVAFRNAVLKAAGGLKIGRKTLRSILSHIRMDAEYVRLVDPETGEPLRDYDIDIRRAVVQRQGVHRARPRLDRWAAELGFVVETEIVPQNIEEILAKVLNEAGYTVGVGDYRLEKNGWFGMFDVQ